MLFPNMGKIALSELEGLAAKSAGVANTVVLHLMTKPFVDIAEVRGVAIWKCAHVGAEVRENMPSPHSIILEFPLIISGLENWHNVAKVGKLLVKTRVEYTNCLGDVKYYEIWYKRTLKDLLRPIVNDEDEVGRLVGDPGGKDWSSEALQKRLEGRLQESYHLYLDIINRMNEITNDLRSELSLDNATVQSRLAPPPTQPPSMSYNLASVRSNLAWMRFRSKFGFSNPKRSKLFDQLKDYNERLEKLLNSSDKSSAQKNATPVNTKETSALETAFKKMWKKSDHLFKALQKVWQCSCQQYHFANLRLEHHALPEINFEIILMFVAPSQVNAIWSRRELQCGQMISCSFPHKLMKPSTTPQLSPCPPSCSPALALLPTSTRQKKVVFAAPAPTVPKIELETPIDPSVNLCQLLVDGECGECMGIIGHNDETYHLHPFTKRKQLDSSGALTLDYILSNNFEAQLNRRQRYSVALLLASSVAQLHSTAWLRTGLRKEDVFFFQCEDDQSSVPYREPFIRQGFSPQSPVVSNTEANDCNFYSLGILLLELCFGQRLEDHPLRKKHPAGAGETKEAYDLFAAMKWSQSVSDEAGDDYASAVKWCFTGANDSNRSWRGEMIKNVIRPLEMCQGHFKTAATP
jgi:hypothetical protein